MNKKLFLLLLIGMMISISILVLTGCNGNARSYKALNLEQSKIEYISDPNYHTHWYEYEAGDTVYVDSTNTINPTDSNTMQYLIIKPLN